MLDAKLSIMGLYNWDNKIWDNLVLPPQINKNDTTLSIMTECADFELLYPSWPTMYNMIGLWSRKHLQEWQKLYNTTMLEYNPIENYDRMEEWVDAGGSTYTDKHNVKTGSEGSQNASGSSTGTNHQADVMENDNTQTYSWTDTGTNTDQHYEAAFNDTYVVMNMKDEHIMGAGRSGTQKDNGGSTTTSEQTSENAGTSKNTYTDTRVEDGANGGEKYEANLRKGRAHGNIGVTTSQQMIEAEREVVRFNVIDEIVQSFKAEFCVLVY